MEEEKTSTLTKEEISDFMHRIQETEDMYELIEITKVEDAKVRLKATQ